MTDELSKSPLDVVDSCIACVKARKSLTACVLTEHIGLLYQTITFWAEFIVRW